MRTLQASLGEDLTTACRITLFYQQPALQSKVQDATEMCEIKRQIASMQKTLDKVDRQLATVCERNYISSDGCVPKRGKGGIANEGIDEGIEGTSNRKVNLTDGFVEVGNGVHNPTTYAKTPALGEPPLPRKSTQYAVSASNNDLYANMVPRHVPTTPMVANAQASENINRMAKVVNYAVNKCILY